MSGLCLGPSNSTLLVINWRSKTVTELDLESGETLSSFTHDEFKEPIDVAVGKDEHILVADNGLGAVLVFEPSGKLVRTIGNGPGKGKGQFKDLSAVCVAPDGSVLVADSRIQVFSPEGEHLRDIFPEGRGKGRYGGLSVDARAGFLVATRTERARSFLQVFRLDSGALYSTIDSHGCKMKRPTGLAVMRADEDRGHLVVVDIGSDCVRKYRYF